MPPGPFTVTVPIAARYDELAKAMGTVFTDGKYFFSTEFPKLYLETPEVYESQGLVVLKVHLKGPVHKFGIDADLEGDVFFSGHLTVSDNEIQIPDLEQTIETKNFFLSLKALTDGQKIRDQARAALRLDLSDRLKAVREKLSSELTFGGPAACFRGNVDKIELTSAHSHGTYLRAYVAVTARAAAMLPCSERALRRRRRPQRRPQRRPSRAPASGWRARGRRARLRVVDHVLELAGEDALRDEVRVLLRERLPCVAVPREGLVRDDDVECVAARRRELRLRLHGDELRRRRSRMRDPIPARARAYAKSLSGHAALLVGGRARATGSSNSVAAHHAL